MRQESLFASMFTKILQCDFRFHEIIIKRNKNKQSYHLFVLLNCDFGCESVS